MSNTEVSRIARLSRHGYDGTPWYGKSLRKLLAGVTAEEARAEPIKGAHTIMQQVQHATVWRRFAIRLLRGERVGRMSPSANWPKPIKADAATWKRTLAELAETQTALDAAISSLTDDRLSDLAPGQKFTLNRLLHGVIHHDAYHAGQIALLKNAVRRKRTKAR